MGYQKDKVSGSYYAQKREYRADIGRFQGMDLSVGFIEKPFSMNRYNYCFNNSMIFTDLNGCEPEKTYCYEKVTDVNGIALVWDNEGKEGTIICGNNANVQDVFAIITLDTLRDDNNGKVQAFVEEYTTRNPDSVIEKGKDISYYEYQPDITYMLTKEMIKNEYESTVGVTSFSWLERLGEFKNNVQNKGSWDLKQKEEWNAASMYIFNGELVDKDAPGNLCMDIWEGYIIFLIVFYIWRHRMRNYKQEQLHFILLRLHMVMIP